MPKRPVVPLRGLGHSGIIADIHPYDLPPNAWSRGNNVRFKDGKVLRAPGFRTAEDAFTASPRFIFGVTPNSGNDYLIHTADDGTIYHWQSGTSTDYSPVGFVGASSDLPFTGTNHGGVVYINRASHVPAQMGPSGSQFAALPGWNSTWRANALRGYKDFMVALNITKGATEYPTMVKWSDEATVGAAPTSWDETDATTLAGETQLAEMKGKLLDGLVLKGAFVLYGDEEVHLMEYNGGRFVFSFRRLFNDDGIINTNAVVEVSGLHYVFGRNDLYVHDGISKRSVAKGKVRDKIFNEMNYSKKDKFFVFHDPVLKSVYFCYNAQDAEAGWRETDYCNRAAVFNYDDGSWSFMDMPNVCSASHLNITYSVTAEQWSDNPTETWDTDGGLWQSFEDGQNRSTVVANRPSAANSIVGDKLYAFDPIDVGSLVPLPLDTSVIKPAFIEREKLDLDEMGVNLSGYKVVHEIRPQLRVFSNISTIDIEVGASAYPQDSTTWEAASSFDPFTAHKVNSRAGGKYIGLRFTKSDAQDFELAGADLQVSVNSFR